MTSAAVITIKKPGAMTKRGRCEIATWLRNQASNLLKHGNDYNDTGNFVARYNYTTKETT